MQNFCIDIPQINHVCFRQQRFSALLPKLIFQIILQGFSLLVRIMYEGDRQWRNTYAKTELSQHWKNMQT